MVKDCTRGLMDRDVIRLGPGIGFSCIVCFCEVMDYFYQLV